MARKRNKPYQPFPISIENFFISTEGVFKEVEVIPDGFDCFFSTEKSRYYSDANREFLVSVSDHWGRKVRYCAWHLDGYPMLNCDDFVERFGRTERIGLIRFDELKINDI